MRLQGASRIVASASLASAPFLNVESPRALLSGFSGCDGLVAARLRAGFQLDSELLIKMSHSFLHMPDPGQIGPFIVNLLAALIGCLLMGAFRCLDMDSAWRSIHWPSLLLIVGMLPFALALQKTGGIDLAVNGLLQLLGDAGPRALIAALFALTAVIGLFISNTATAVLMAPVAIATAQALGVSPMPFAITVAVAASAAFMTPVSSPVNTLVLAPGGYRFIDFVRIGVPLTLLVMLASTLLIPLLFPL